MIRIVTPHRTAERRLTDPTPMIEDVMTWVVLTGIPKCAVPSRISAPLVSAANRIALELGAEITDSYCEFQVAD